MRVCHHSPGGEWLSSCHSSCMIPLYILSRTQIAGGYEFLSMSRT
ncbi:hypothetical protein ACFONI_16370 [Aeromonas media]